MTTHAFAAQEKGKNLVPFDYEPDGLGPFDIEIDITHCGVCYSDVHMIDAEFPDVKFPLVPGHEIVGTVSKKGDLVRLDLGQRVGVGWQRSACLDCDTCVSGHDNLCPSIQATIVGHHGGFADVIRTDARYAFPIPDALPSEGAAPLLCGGVTVFGPMKQYNLRPEMKVGVIGVGGLGHMAIKFANAMGCEVVALSHTKEKEGEAKALGAHRFVHTEDKEQFAAEKGNLDFMISTVHADLNWAAYLDLLAVTGRLVVLGVTTKALSVPVFPLLVGAKSICGSVIGSRWTIREMLEFAARHKITATTESFAMSDVNTAIERLRKGDVRYRAVLVN